jgi:predicted permease
MNDLRFAWRMLWKSRGFTLAAAGLLAAGIGVTTLIFSAVDAILLRPLPVPHPEQLLRFVQSFPRVGFDSQIPSPVYRALRDRSTTLSAVFGEHEEDVPMTDTKPEPGPAERVRVHLVTPDFFDALGVHAVFGRTLTVDDATDNPGDPPAVLSYAFWQRRFNGDPKALGQTIRVQDHTFVIVGVLSREFNGFAADTAPDIRLPLRALTLIAAGFAGRVDEASLDLAGRLKPGVSMAQARAESTVIWSAALAPFKNTSRPMGRPDYPLELAPLEHGTSILRDRYGPALKFLIACSIFLLLMVCANVAGLLLARSAVRRQEIAVRLAVGATRARLARQMLVESALLAALGAAGGVVLAAALTPILARLLPPIHDLSSNRLTLSLGLGVDRRVLLFSLAVAMATVLLFGLAPAIAASRTSLDSILRGARSSHRWSGRQALLVVQVALCTLLLTGAGLLIRTFEQLHNLNPGFDAEHVLTFTIDPPILYKPGMAIESLQKLTVAFFDTLQERIRETPGVASVALAEVGVLRDHGMGGTVAPAGQRPSEADFIATNANGVTPKYFETMGIHLLEGRLLGGYFDSQTKPAPAVVNQAFVERHFPGVNPLGKRFGYAAPGKLAGADKEIIGVVGDAKYRSLREPIQPIVYTPFSYPELLAVVHVRTRVKPEQMIQPVRRAIASLDSAMPIIEIDTLADEVDASSSGERLTATLGSTFAILVVLLSAAGIYGLLAYAVTQRRREIGIRMALGATPADVHELIGRQALGIVIGGVILGLAAARASAPLIAGLLYGIAPQDLRSLVGAALAVLAMAAIASAIPAMRAARINPAIALRDDH